jgi:hypothetical protein
MVMNDRNLFKIALAVLLIPAAFAAGCQDRYRYACQDPENWNTERCQKPKCEIHRDCPEHIFKEQSQSVGVKVEKPQTCDKGCK